MTTNVAEWKDTQFVNSTLLKPGISVEESQELYRQWAETGTYDEMLNKKPQDYAGLRALTNAITGLWKDKNALILDVGAGTGLTGQTLLDVGYTNIHALEPQANFAQTAREKGLYKKVIQEFIGAEKPLDIADDTYDGMISSGAFGPGHIPVSAIPEMVRLTKPGGFIVICMRKEFLTVAPEYKDKLEPLWNQLEHQGKWKLIEREVYPNHFVNKDGLMVKYQVC